MEKNEHLVVQNLTWHKKQQEGRWKLLFIIVVCISPLLLSYLTYFVIKPESRTNYGAFIDAKAYPIPKLESTGLDGKLQSLEALKGKWIMLQVDSGDCQASCNKKMHDMRQLRIAQGKERNRIERVWLITDKKTLEPTLLQEYEGTKMLRTKYELIQKWLPTEPGTLATDHIYLIDPLGNLMMRFPQDANANKIKKDLSRLLKASGIG